ncbi:MAG: CPBP family intramembrane metalloprotease [Synergistaceae bacterium]|jgi:membrane protease YdiL (CAAX protease family)|nr:CPBP family intramembrane metalloprotease [Synergistaceae bacterium]
MTISDVIKGLVGFAAAAFMLYFPYVWCSRRGRNEFDYGLRWFMGPAACRDVVLALLLTLVPLTWVSYNWPRSLGVGGPFSPSLMSALNMLGGGVAAAFVEEPFFRGFLQSTLVKKLGAPLAIVLTSALFALSHLFVAPSWLRLATFFPGLVMGFLRYRHGSIMPSVIYHALCNVWAVWWMPRV